MNRERTTQEELKDRLVSPGILGLAAAAGAFALAYNIWWNHAYVDPRPELDPFASLLEFFFIVLGLVIAIYGGRSLVDTGYRVSGGVVFACSLVTGLFVLPGALGTSTLINELIFAGYLSSSTLGIIGGLKGIFWERSWSNGAAVPELAEYSRWALIGGLALLIDAPSHDPEPLAFLPSTEPLVFLPSIVVLVSGALVYKGIGNRRLLALMIIASALYATNSLFLYYGVFRLNYGLTIAGILGKAGIVLSVIAGVKIWTSKASKLHAPKQ
jgi:hypothetical protein